MSETANAPLRFSEHEEGDITEYRPFNRFAMTSAILGLLSAIALTHPLLWIVPIIGTGVGVLALMRIRLSGTSTEGKGLAVLGMALSVLFLSWSFTWTYSRQTILTNAAKAFAEEWFGMMNQERWFAAHQMTLEEPRRVAPGKSLEEHYAPREKIDVRKMMESRGITDPTKMSPSDREQMMDPESEPPLESFARFFEEPIPKKLKAIGAGANIRFLQLQELLDAGSDNTHVTLLYSIDEQVRGQTQSTPFLIQLQRSLVKNTANWQIVRVADYHP